MTLGSLFDGSGGFPLAGALNGFTPMWASEIEPYPLRVTSLRFPHMEQLGNILDVDGALAEPVDVITFGSPCQDLSVAGKQAGIHDGERSNLFFEAVRIIREMRGATNGKYPRFAVWENVPGAFSSNKGEDFQAVLQALCEAADPGAAVPEPPKGKWSKAGCIVGDGYSVAWRVYDAQYWGVPQRRKRIYLVADFGSERAGEILFEQEGLRWDSAPGGEAREGTSDDVAGSAGGGCHAFDITGITSNSMKSPTPDSCFKERTISRSLDTFVGSPECNQGGTVVVYDCRGNGNGSVVPNLTGDHQNRVTDYTGITVYDTTQITSPHNRSNPKSGDPFHTLGAQNHPPLVVCVGNGQMHQTDLGDKSGALNCMHDQQAVVHSANPPLRYIVRRLTPLECCRLQGFPDWWEDGANGSDSARYKMWGNGIALPCAADVMRRIAKEMNHDGTKPD